MNREFSYKIADSKSLSKSLIFSVFRRFSCKFGKLWLHLTVVENGGVGGFSGWWNDSGFTGFQKYPNIYLENVIIYSWISVLCH